MNICLCRCVRKSLHTSVSLIAAASAAAIRSCSACISALSPSTVSPFDSFPNVRAASLLESTSVAPIPAAVLRHRSASFRSASASAFAVLPKQSGFFQFNTKSIYISTHTHTHTHTYTHTHTHTYTHAHVLTHTHAFTSQALVSGRSLPQCLLRAGERVVRQTQRCVLLDSLLPLLFYLHL